MTAFTRRRALGGTAAGAAALALAACGGSGGTSGSGASDGEEGGTRTVTDASGAEVEVPTAPTRVVTLHYAATQAMIDLGQVPVGTSALLDGDGSEEEALKYTSAEIWEQIKDLPTIDAEPAVPDIEKVAELEPDLILAHNALDESVLAQVQDIAPTYQFLLRGGDRKQWWTRVEQVADALNRTEAYTELNAAWEEELAAATEEYQDVAEGLVVGVYGVYEEGNVYVWGEENMAGTILTPLGVSWSEQANAAVEGEESAEKPVAVEQTLDVLGDATVLFYDSNMQAEASPLVQAYQESELYQQLPAVEEGRTFAFGKCTIAGFTDARYSLDQVTSALDSLRG